MPAARNPNARKWYVYQFEVARGHRRTPFYVGIGHHQVGPGRAEDRLRWVCSQIRRELEGRPGKWVLHTEVMKWLILAPEKITCRYICKGLRRNDALLEEGKRIALLRSRGFLLANVQMGERPQPSVKDILSFLRHRSK